MAALIGAGSDLVFMPTLSLTHVVFDPADASTEFRLNSTGLYAGIEDVTTTFSGSWVTPNINAALYECFATLNSGALTTGTTGAWLGLGTNRSWTKTQTVVGLSAASITIQIRRISTGVVMATGAIDFYAEVFI